MSAPNGARGHRFDPARAGRLDDPDRFTYLAPAAVASLLDTPPNGTLLDFGAGTGTYALALAALRPDIRIVALDIEPEMLRLLGQKDGAQRIECAGPERLAGYAGSIDRVIAINVLHELGHADLRALFAIAHAETRFAFIDWNADVERPSGPAKDRLYGPSEAAEHLASFGFMPERTESYPYQYGLLGRIAR